MQVDERGDGVDAREDQDGLDLRDAEALAGRALFLEERDAGLDFVLLEALAELSIDFRAASQKFGFGERGAGGGEGGDLGDEDHGPGLAAHERGELDGD